MKRKKPASRKGGTRSAFYQARFEGYEGKNRWEVCHPSHLPTIVAAPDENAALVAAAEFNGMRWRDYSYYAYATVLKATEGEKK